MAAEDGPFAINSDGSAKDPLAFQKALKEDVSKLKALEAEPEVYKIVLDGDSDNFQQLLRAAYAVRSCAARQAMVPFPRSMRYVTANFYTSIAEESLQAEKKRLERASKTMAERTIDAQRASAPMPR